MIIFLVSFLDKWQNNEPIFPDRATAWWMAVVEFVAFDVPIAGVLIVMWGSVFS
jgi:hypothetical protein